MKDPDGFDLQISNGSPKNRRQGPATAKTSAPAPFEGTNWKTIWLDHISFEVSNYKETVAFYSALLGWKPGTDEGSQNQCEIGDVGDIIIRRGGGGNRGGGAARDAGGAPGRDGPHRIRHHALRSRPVKAELEKARTHGSCRHRGQRRHSHVRLQELSHDDAERIRSADQRDDARDARCVAAPSSRLIHRLPADDGADDLDVLDFFMVHRVRIVREHHEVRQLARRDRSLDRLPRARRTRR